MKVSRKNQLRSVMVLVIAALLLELTTAVQFFSMRRNVSKQLMEMAQRDLSATNQTAQLKQEVEGMMAQILPDIERFWLVDCFSYGGVPTCGQLVAPLAVGTLLVVFWLIVGSVLLERREIS